MSNRGWAKFAPKKTDDEGKRPKYGNKKATSFDGKEFHSIWEAKCYENFRYMQMAGKVLEINMQVHYKLCVDSILICTYIADFVITWPNGEKVVYDSKGVETPDFVIKKKLMKACLGIEVILLKKADKTNFPWLDAGRF